ncbi:MAG TPA: hypothetical protein VNZ03_13315 [Terriglobales bacterium]|jgi:hypothetical protein|nr:hypothetical protein [Terriglobales bacterium]
MLNKEPGPERAQLGFKDAVLSHFKFLSDFGLRPVEEKVTFVRYESPHVFVNIYHGRASYELGAEIGKVKEPEKKLHIFSVVRWAGAEKVEGLGQHVMFQIGSREGVQEFVPKLAALVRKYAIPLLRGDESAYRSALEFQAKQYADEVKEGNLRVLRSKAEAAWRAKDYAQVIELYGPVREDLTEVEAKKLAYAEQRVLAAEGVGSRFSRKRR